MSNINMSFLITIDDKQNAKRTDVLTRLASLRWQHETAGLVLADGRCIQTGRDSQSQIANIATEVRAGLTTDPIPWKTPQGWTEFSPAEFLALATQIRCHVQKCFAAERRISVEVLASDSPERIDLETAFQTALQNATVAS